MARDVFLDVTLEVSAADLPVGQSGQIILDKLRPKVEAEVAAIPGARLRVDSRVEMHVSHAEHKLTGEDMVLVATRWPVVVPESARLYG